MTSNLDKYLARLVAYEVLLIGIVALAYGMFWDVAQAKATVFAGVVVMINTLLLGTRVQGLEQEGGNVQARLLGGAVQRFVFTLASMALAFGWLRLPVAGILTGLILGHLIFLVHAARAKSPVQNQ